MNSEEQTERHEKWRELVENQEKSGLTQTEYCKQHHLSIAKFTYYRGLIKARDHIPSQKLTTFTPVKINKTEQISSADIRIILPNGFQCFIPCSVDTHHVKRLLEVLLSC